MGTHALPFPEHVRRGHREVLLESLRARGAAALLWSGRRSRRGQDLWDRFRPASNFFYLTGLAEPEAALLLIPDRDRGQCLLFLRPNDALEEGWDAPRLGVAAAREQLGIDEARSIEALPADLPRLLAGRGRLLLCDGHDPRFPGEVAAWLAGSGLGDPASWIEADELLLEQRLIKGRSELELMRRAAEVCAAAHFDLMRCLRPGLSALELEGRFGLALRRGGAREAFPTLIAAGERALCLHDDGNSQRLEAGQLVLVDGGAELGGYSSDVTRCLPVGGRLDPLQRALLEALFEIQERLVRSVRPGLPLGALEELGARLQCQALVQLGLLRGDPDGLFAQSAQRRFTRHRLCHFVGVDVHDGGARALDPGRRLAPGMVLAIEPGFYLGAREPELASPWRGLAARLEDQVQVTATGAELWTYGAPRAPSEVEAACQLGLPAEGGP